MDKTVNIDSIYILSEDVVLRKIGDESIIVPIAAGIGDMEDELYTVNKTGMAIMSLLDGKRNLGEVIKSLSSVFDAGEDTLTADAIGFVSELYRRKILVEAR